VDAPGLRASQRDSDEILAPFFWAWFRARGHSQIGWYYPTGPAEVSVAGVDPARILLIGDAPAAGCGVVIHELGVAGRLASHVAVRTGRGVSVTVAAQPAASARSTLKRLRSLNLGGYDAIVLMLATTDALCLTPRRSWRRSMAGIIDLLNSAGGARVFVTGTSSMHLANSLSPFGRRHTGRHARMLDTETSWICAESGTPMIPLDAASDLGSVTYARWGHRIGAYVAEALDDPAPQPDL
jgi:hypothetical protein